MTRRALLIPVLLLVANGCEPAGPKVYQVTGKVTIDGAPAKDVQITFQPLDSTGVVGSSRVAPDGKYSITSGNEGKPGISAGKYKVVLQPLASSDPTAAMAKYKTTPQGGAPKMEVTFPKEYSDAATSPKEVEVKPQANTIDIDIKS